MNGTDNSYDPATDPNETESYGRRPGKSVKAFWHNVGHVDAQRQRTYTIEFGGRHLYAMGPASSTELEILQCDDRSIFNVLTTSGHHTMLSLTNSVKMLREVLRGYNVPERRIREIIAKSRQA